MMWWLAKGEVLLAVSDKFNVAVSTVYVYTKFIFSKLISLINIVPKLLMIYLENAVILVIGGVVTCNKMFTNVMVGLPGSVHDSRTRKQMVILASIFSTINIWWKILDISSLQMVNDSIQR